ncbi:hypothetical protein ACIRSS_18025 [Amycolatopsis sp. NPDC101161]|uniref:hypothetical protein n=1 Tax=Amycolatopsis sp. NPDC101161 TaxID=3363940 RepID=UPI00380A2727
MQTIIPSTVRVESADSELAATERPALPLHGTVTTQLPALGGASNVTQPAGSTPLTQGGRYNTSAVTAPVTQHGPSALESATKLLGK